MELLSFASWTGRGGATGASIYSDAGYLACAKVMCD